MIEHAQTVDDGEHSTEGATGGNGDRTTEGAAASGANSGALKRQATTRCAARTPSTCNSVTSAAAGRAARREQDTLTAGAGGNGAASAANGLAARREQNALTASGSGNANALENRAHAPRGSFHCHCRV